MLKRKLFKLLLRLFRLDEKQQLAVLSIVNGYATIYGTEVILGERSIMKNMTLIDSELGSGDCTSITPKY